VGNVGARTSHRDVDSARTREKGTAHGSSLEDAGRAGVTPSAEDQEGLRGLELSSESSDPEDEQGSRREPGEEARRVKARLVCGRAPRARGRRW
jgi:hypothetical protein